jgi:hypothetical protein
MKISHGFMELIHTDNEIIECADPLCSRFIHPEEKCFVDVSSDEGRIYCKLCGPCERYHRKKAKERQLLQRRT